MMNRFYGCNWQHAQAIRYDVVTAKSHGDAMEYYRQAKEANKPFSFIMTDLTMRGEEGR